MNSRELFAVGLRLIGAYFTMYYLLALAGAVVWLLAMSQESNMAAGFLESTKAGLIGTGVIAIVAVVTGLLLLFRADHLAVRLVPGPSEGPALTPGIRELLYVGLVLLGIGLVTTHAWSVLETLAKLAWQMEASRRALLEYFLASVYDHFFSDLAITAVGLILTLRAGRLADRLAPLPSDSA